MNAAPTLADFMTSGPGPAPAPGREIHEAYQDTVPVGPNPIRNFPLARNTCLETREKYPRQAVWLLSNGSPDRQATEWYVRRCVA